MLAGRRDVCFWTRWRVACDIYFTKSVTPRSPTIRTCMKTCGGGPSHRKWIVTWNSQPHLFAPNAPLAWRISNVRRKMSALILRQSKDTDFELFAEMNSDPEVMHYLLPMTRSDSVGAFSRLRNEMTQRGWGVWAVEVDGIFAGMVGLHVPDYPLPFSPCTEVLWRLRKEFWGRGIAHEAAGKAIDYGFSKAGQEEIVSFTTPQNLRSIRLMERLGFERDHQGDFDHPKVPMGHHLRRHVLYRKQKPNKWVEASG